jgi:hypothetical protein
MHVSKVTVHLVLQGVPVYTTPDPQDITVKDWKEILYAAVREHLNKNTIIGMIRDYKISETIKNEDM